MPAQAGIPLPSLARGCTAGRNPGLTIDCYHHRVMRWTKPQDYKNFRRAQREPGPYARNPAPEVERPRWWQRLRLPAPPRFTPFTRLVMLSSALVFLVVLVGDRLVLSKYDRPAVFYPTCRAARAAGAAPIPRISPDYRPQLDTDHDGIACEPAFGLPGRLLFGF